MQVRDIMTNRLAYCTPQANLEEVAEMMVQYDCGAIPVIDPGSNKALGLITDRDIVCRSVAIHQNPAGMTAQQVMSEPVAAVTPQSSLEDCLTKMEAAQVRRMLVVDQAGKLCGMVSQADIVRTLPEHEIAELLRDVSTPTGTASQQIH
jgi:CBS domain-containing protein